MPAATRSKTRGDPVNAPQKSPNQESTVRPGKVQKDPEAARIHGTDLLQTLQEEHERELHDALGTESHGHGRGNGRGCGHGRGRSRGHGGGGVGGAWSVEETTPAVNDAPFMASSDMDGLDGDVGHSFVGF